MLGADFYSVVAEWKQNLASTDILVREHSAAGAGFAEDYHVAQEVVFEPPDLKRARAEFWITDKGAVAVGIETLERIAQRLGHRTTKSGFAAGHEPRLVNKKSFETLVEIVSAGRILIGVWSVFGFVISCRLYLRQRDYDTLADMGYRCSDWVSTEDRRATPYRFFGVRRQLLVCHPWLS